MKLTGTPDQVRARLEALHASGELVSLTPPKPADRPGQVVVRVQLRDVQPRQHPDTHHDKVGTAPRQDWRVPVAVFGAVVGAAVAVVALLWWAVLWVAAHVALVLGLLAALLLVLFLAGRAGACPGFHCPGCRHR